MRLEDALKLSKGTVLRATYSWVAPEQITKGKTYVMQADARPIYAERGGLLSSLSQFKSKPNSRPVNAELPIIDDGGSSVNPVYLHFEVVR